MLLLRNYTLVPFRLKPSVPVATCHFSTTNFNPSPAQAQKTGDEPILKKDIIKPPAKRPLSSFMRFNLERWKQQKESLKTPVSYKVSLRESGAAWSKLSDAEKLTYATPPELYEEHRAYLKKWYEGLSDEDKKTRRRSRKADYGYPLFLSETFKDAKGDNMAERQSDRGVAWKSLSTEQRAEYKKRAADTFFGKIDKPPIKRPVPPFIRFTLEKIKQDKESLKTPVPYHVALRECAAVWNKLSDAEKLSYATPPKLYEEHRAYLKKWYEGLSDEDKKIRRRSRKAEYGYSLFLSETFKDAKGDNFKEKTSDRGAVWKSLSTEQRAEYKKRAADSYFGLKIDKPLIKRPSPPFIRFTLEKIKHDKESLKTPVPYPVALRECADVWNKLSDAEKMPYATPPKLYEEHSASVKKWNEDLSDKVKKALKIRQRLKVKTGKSLFFSETFKDAKGDNFGEKISDRALVWKSLSTEQRADYRKRAAETLFGIRAERAAQRERELVQEAKVRTKAEESEEGGDKGRGERKETAEIALELY